MAEGNKSCRTEPSVRPRLFPQARTVLRRDYSTSVAPIERDMPDLSTDAYVNDPTSRVRVPVVEPTLPPTKAAAASSSRTSS